MQSHPYFNLLLHEDDELAEYLESQIITRTTLHEWPLSCVQQLILQDGRKMVYKASWGPTVEAEFYTRAKSILLVPVRTLYSIDGYSCLLIDWIEACRVEDSDLSEAGILRTAHTLMDEIQHLSGDLPCYLDLRADGWLSVVDQIISPLYSLCQDRKFQRIKNEEIECIKRWCEDKSTLDVLDVNPGLVHGDLSGDNVFILDDGYRVIDWQRPMYGPQELDLVDLLESCGFEAKNHVEIEIIRLRRLLSIHWLTQCALHWFPEGAPTYDQQIAALVVKMEAGE